MKPSLVSRCLLSICILIFYAARLNAATITTTAPDSVCTDTLMPYTGSSVHTGFLTYDWSTTPKSSGYIYMNGSSSIQVMWFSAGTDTLKLKVDSAGIAVDSAIYIVHVFTPPSPFITTTTKVACQTFDSSRTHDILPYPPYILSDTDGCIKMCGGSTIQFSAGGTNPSTDKYKWRVVSGVILGSDSGASVIVRWLDTIAAGRISLTVTNKIGCTGGYTVCIDIVQKPTALFAIDTSTQYHRTYEVCKQTPVLFKDLSIPDTFTDIADRHWDFGDGITSNQKSPTHSFNTSGTYQVFLTVTNRCGCQDTISTTITVDNTVGPTISCAAIKCIGDTATYTTSSCTGASYNWNISTGGTIIAGGTTSDAFVTLRWDSVNADGYGTVSLYVTGCSTLCPGVTILKIPVVQSRPTIKGPTNKVLCAGTTYNFSLPLWPGTRYDWGVIGSPGSTLIKSGKHSNAVSMIFETGTYRIHVWWQNGLTGCGGDTNFTVVVNDHAVINGEEILCRGESYTYNLVPPTLLDVNWQLGLPDGTMLALTGSDHFTTSYAEKGLYVLTANSNSMCTPAALYISVTDTSTVTATTITGDTSICPGMPYVYHAYPPAPPGFKYYWGPRSILTPDSLGDSVTAMWSTLTTRAFITVELIPDMGFTTCWRGPFTGLYVSPKRTQPKIAGNFIPCGNTRETYVDSVDADATNWLIIADTLGSSGTGYKEDTVSVMWHNVAAIQSGHIIVNTNVCGVAGTDTEVVHVYPSPKLFIFDPGTLCNNSATTFRAQSGADTLFWSFGDGGTGISVQPDTSIVHIYSAKATGSAVPYIVTVTASPSSGTTCAPVGPSTRTVSVNTGPVVHIFTSNPILWCAKPVKDTLYSTVTHSSGHIRYDWYNGATKIRSGGSDTLRTAATGTYTLKVTDSSTGCVVSSESIFISITNCSCAGTVSFSSRFKCDTLEITATRSPHGNSPSWTCAGASLITNPTDTSTQIAFTNAGYYLIDYYDSFPSLGCHREFYFYDSVPMTADFYWTWTCPGSAANDTINIYDNTSLLNTWSETGLLREVFNGSTLVGSSTSSSSTPYRIALSAGTYTIAERVISSPGGSLYDTCVVTKTIVVPAKTTVSIQETYGNGCDQLPVFFKPVTSGAGIRSYLWKFGDSASSILSNPQRTYSYKSLIAGGSPNHDSFLVNLSVIDSLGCIATNSITDSIYPNLFLSGGGYIQRPPYSFGSGHIYGCPSEPVTLYFHNLSTATPTRYEWSSGGQRDTISVTQEGIYGVTAYDAHHCWLQVTPTYPIIMPVPADKGILGGSQFCAGQPVVLDVKPSPEFYYSYEWFRGSTLVSTNHVLNDPGLATGTYVYKVVIINSVGGIETCYDTSRNDTIVVNNMPAKPLILNAIVDCAHDKYTLVSDSVTGLSYNWSNGETGRVDTVFDGGAYRVWNTDANGCSNYADTLLPYFPDAYMAWVPTGCYTLCNQSTPDSVYGPPDYFASWKWLKDGTSYTTGINSVPRPLALVSGTGDHNYQMALGNSFCTDTSNPVMSLHYMSCTCNPLVSRATQKPACDTSADGYILTLYTDTLLVPMNTAATVSFNSGPSKPFNITLHAAHKLDTFRIHFTTLLPPNNVTIVAVKYYNGSSWCEDTMSFHIDSCTSWPAERLTGGALTQTVPNERKAATGMIVYPNPSKNILYVNYVYDDVCNCERRIEMINVTGNLVKAVRVNDVTGTWSFDTDGLPAGSYIIKMSENGRILHAAHVSVVH